MFSYRDVLKKSSKIQILKSFIHYLVPEIISPLILRHTRNGHIYSTDTRLKVTLQQY
jgi:hypothetical protein